MSGLGEIIVDGFFSGLAGFFGMKTATYASARTANAARQSMDAGLKIAFRSGAVMGLTVVGLGLLDIAIWFLVLNHFYQAPHLAILPYLKKTFDNIYYIGSENGIERRIIKSAGIPYYAVPCAKLNRKFTLKNLAIPFTLIKGVKKAEKLIKTLKPDVIFSKGGYVALPVVFAAKDKVPVIAHESDYTMGLANRISAKYCKRVLTSFPNTAKTLKNGVYVGAPIRPSLFLADKHESRKQFGFSGEKPVLLVTGGSLGASAINNALRGALDSLLKNFDILHISGKGNLSGIKKVGYRETEFTDQMDKAFACADLCISRAGANTVFEMASLQKPMLLIPLPKGVSRGDQVLNADYFKNLGLARVLEQNKLSPERLTEEVYTLYEGRKIFAENFKAHPVKSSAKKIAEILAKTAVKD